MNALYYIGPTTLRDRKTRRPRSVQLVETLTLSPEEASARARTLARLIFEAAMHRRARLRAARVRDTLTTRKATRRTR